MIPGPTFRVRLAALSGLLASACGSSESAVDGGLLDASAGAFGAPCVVSQTCTSAVCLPFTANAQDASGICSSLCTSSTECGSGGACVAVGALDGGACFPTCMAAGDCAGGLPCVWNLSLDGGLCQPLPASFCAGLATQGTCQQCLGASCCEQVTACVEDVACSMLESSCPGSTSCASALQSSGNGAARALGICAASSCGAACQ